MRHKLFKKYFSATAAIVLFSLTAMMIILTFVYSSHLTGEKYKALNKACDSVTDFAEYAYSNNSESFNRDVYYVISNSASVYDFDIFVTDKGGVIRICSCKEWEESGNCDHTGTAIPKQDIAEILKKENGAMSTLDIFSTPRYTVGDALGGDKGTLYGYIIAAASADEVKALAAKVIRIYLMSAVFPIVFMFFALYIMSYRMIRPLKLMSEAARAMAKGDFSRRIPVTSDDEIGELAVAFNGMTNSLARLEEMRKSFVANISHELRTPMTTIGGFIDGIIDGTIEPERQSYYLGIASEEVKRLSRMVESMLSLSRLESGEFAPKYEQFDFREQVLNIVISQEQRIEQKSIDIVGLDELPAVTVNADKDLIYRVIYNLVDNAIKFTEESGRISFAVKIDAKNVSFSIENTGMGIPKSELPFVFDRFYKVDKSRSANKSSTGLGLYMAKTIIKNHGGSISVSSIENGITAFEFKLPLNK